MKVVFDIYRPDTHIVNSVNETDFIHLAENLAKQFQAAGRRHIFVVSRRSKGDYRWFAVGKGYAGAVRHCMALLDGRWRVGTEDEEKKANEAIMSEAKAQRSKQMMETMEQAQVAAMVALAQVQASKAEASNGINNGGENLNLRDTGSPVAGNDSKNSRK